MKKYCFIIAIIAIVALYFSCTQDVAGTNDETSGGIIAALYYRDGTPADNAVIKIFEVSDTTKQPVYTAFTDDNGEYNIDSMKVGTYNVWGAKDTLVAFQGSVLFTATASNLRDDTLERGGSINSIVGLEPTDDPRTVTVQILGSEISVENVDTSGRFTIPDLDEGSYKLRLATTLPNYTTTYYTIQKNDDLADTITDTLRLIYTGIPVVTGMKVTYDTLHGVATLSWDKVQYMNLQDYLVYRAHKDSGQWPASPILYVSDTVTIDSVFKKSLAWGPFSFSDTNDYHFKYRVCVRNNSDQIGLPYKYVDIQTPSPTKVRTFFSWQYLNTIADSASINDSVSIIVSYRNATRKNMKLCWYVNTKDSVFKTKEDSSLTGTDSIKYAWPVVSKPKVYASMVDEGNTTWWDSTMLNIIQSAPVITSILPDTIISVNDSITLWATVVDNDGNIEEYAWDGNGDGVFDYTSATETNTGYRYTISGFYRSIFRVTDDYGKTDKDTVVITVYGSVTDIDGNGYHTLKIGNQEWTIENLRTTKYNDGTEIPLIADSAAWAGLITPGYCYNNNTSDSAFIKNYGALYNWYAVDTKKLAPAGWHVPTHAEWTILENYLIANGYNWDGTTTGNKIAKSMAAKTDWRTSTKAGSPGYDLTKNNMSGFSALPGGRCNSSGYFESNGGGGYWWSATENDTSNGCSRSLAYQYEGLTRSYSYAKSCGFSVRLLKDTD